MKDAIAIKVTTKDPKHYYIVRFASGTYTVVDVLDCKTLFDFEQQGAGRIPARTVEIIAAARSGIGKTFETATAGEDQ